MNSPFEPLIGRNKPNGQRTEKVDTDMKEILKINATTPSLKTNL